MNGCRHHVDSKLIEVKGKTALTHVDYVSGKSDL